MFKLFRIGNNTVYLDLAITTCMASLNILFVYDEVWQLQKRTYTLKWNTWAKLLFDPYDFVPLLAVVLFI